MFGKSGAFKPRYGKNNQSFLPLPATFNRLSQRRNLPLVITGILILWYFFAPFSIISSLFGSSTAPHYPPEHPYSSKHTIAHQSKFIYPPIEQASLLKQLTAQKLVVHQSKIGDKTILEPLSVLDNPDPTVQRMKENDENGKDQFMKAKNAFKNQDRVVFKPKSLKNYPEVVIVTAVDFDKYSADGLAKIVQNRVDYAHFQRYGVYVRWAQEFIPQLNSITALTDKERSKWVRLFCTSAAMFAFPHAKWFWYLDEDGLIMDMTANVQKLLLNSDVLNPQMLRDQPLIPNTGLIKTYKSIKAESAQLILTQSEKKIETTSFVVRNGPVGKAILETWSNDLYLNYRSFPYGPDSALTHLLQWHPFVLSKTTLVPAKTICASHSSSIAKEYSYTEGDLVVQWNDCKSPAECEEILNAYQPKVKKP
ncbi:MNN11 [Candida margitis]|uniref:MNN11 n=1 Tax=Candida margitis TaxID=1775924 RepID=UPI00222752D8|nr:MNN11 [Candida margitis]KAI5949691.1 MNN11 [Candida margitis]